MTDTEVQRGTFDKDGSRFDVCASSALAPEAMRVYQAGDRSVIALVVSGLNSGDLKASWGAGWGDYPLEWRDDFEERAYRAYVSRVRVCNG
ncbi:hypothetical protein [Glycomyces sp. NPDC047010]|uniref:hypothetical protein n=1 Tax=Glycomyces sp. NPDC047010 TaxID=3155023 RepID=UPI0033D4F652